jgi:2-polyprenyl-3-methyl-5-hydroxy-6-metoxy-1,4-benzoquinol methylase
MNFIATPFPARVRTPLPNGCSRWSHLVPSGAPVLDVACGAGRHLRWFQALGHPVTGMDRDPLAVQAAAQAGEADRSRH